VLRKLKHIGYMSDTHSMLGREQLQPLKNIGLSLRPQLFFFF